MDKTKKTKIEDSEVGKYLTDMKELPPAVKAEAKPAKPAVKAAAEKPEPVKAPEKKAEEKPVEETKSGKAASDEFDMKEDSAKIFSLKDILLGVINVLSVIVIIFLLTKLPMKALELQAERVEDIQNQVNPNSEYGNIEGDREKANKLRSLFLDQSGIVNFVSDVEKLKQSESAISKVTFASPKPIKDQLGLYGIPVIIELKGNWNTIAPAMQKIQLLPYLFRAINVEAGPSKDDPDVLTVSYGGFLYVNDKEAGK